MDNGLVGGHVDTAVLLGCRETEHMVILVDGTAYRTQGVMAVGHRVGDGEFIQAGGTGCLNDADVCDVVAHHGIELDAHFVTLAAVYIVAAKNSVSNGVFSCLCGRGQVLRICGKLFAIKQINAFVNNFNHRVLDLK